MTAMHRPPQHPTAQSRPRIITDREPRTVIVAVALPAPPEQVWQALTDPQIVERWFGNLTFDSGHPQAMEPGARARLDFDDGDFFAIEVISAEAPRRLEYDWRFLGLGALSRVRFSLLPDAKGCLVTVSDDYRYRAGAEAVELRAGWHDFLTRLECHLRTGERARYDWRADIDGAIELSGPARRLLEPDLLPAWLPLEGGELSERAQLALDDDQEPARFAIEAVRWGPGPRVEFDVSRPEWDRPTTCALAVEPRPRGSSLVFSHNGWRELGLDDAAARRLRTRFAQAWTRALASASEVLTHAGADGVLTR